MHSFAKTGLISLQYNFNETVQEFLLRSNWLEMLNLASWRNFKAIVISFLGLLTFVTDDMFHGKMVVLVECHNFSPSLVEKKLDCGQIF